MGAGRLVIVSGPSGVGKDTVIDTWKLANPSVERVVAYTTRGIRRGEVDGIHYHFVTVDEFQEMAAAGKFLEHKRVIENYYATPVKETDQLLADGKIAILKIDVQGALEVMQKRPYAMSVMLLPPTKETLRERLVTRDQDNLDVIERRLLEAEVEMAQASRYQHQIVNRNVGEVVAQLLELTA